MNLSTLSNQNFAPQATSIVDEQAPVKPSLYGATRADLRAALTALDVPVREHNMRVSQLWNFLYVRGVREFEAMHTLGKNLRDALTQNYTLERPKIITAQVSSDGTRKWLLRLNAHSAREKTPEVECVYIPEEDRGTLCISSQIGCTLSCSFCHTGTQKLLRNLTAQEIIAQVMLARDELGEYQGGVRPTDGLLPSPELRAISNIVFMGMGEPLYNFDAVRDAVQVITDGEGLSLSRRRVTVSTAGVVPQIEKLGTEAQAMLAISLHATHNDLRNELVPLNRKYPIKELIAACRHYPGASNARRITFEYVMLKGINDTPAEARALVRLLKGIPAKINLIPFNPWPGTRYECSDWDTIEKFSSIIFNAGYASPVRTPRGRDILAACGQLKSESEKLRARAQMIVEDAQEQGATPSA